MIKSRLIEVLRTLSRKERRDLSKWVISPAYNQRKDVVLLLEYLIEKENLQSDDKLLKEEVFEKVYPDEPYDDAKMRQVMHFLFKVVEAYLIHITAVENKIMEQLLLAKFYRRRGLSKSFEKSIKRIEDLQKGKFTRDDQFLYEEFLVQLEKYKFFNKASRRIAKFNLQEISDVFDQYYIANKLKQASWMLSHQAVFHTEYDNVFLEHIISHLENTPDLLDNPAIGIYFFTFKMQANEEEETHFIHLKESLRKNTGQLPLNEMQNLYLFAINYCAKKINNGKSQFISEAWELQKRGLEEGILIQDGYLNRFIYRNFITTGIRLGYYDKVNEYIFKYGELLREEYKDNFIKFSLAKLFYEKGSYEKAMELVSQYEFKDILVNLSAKTMLLKMYYEQSEFRVLESLLESMRAYLQRKKVLGYHKANYKNIIRYTKKLLKVNPYSKAQVNKLRQEMEAVNPLTEKKWLLRQLEEL